MRAFFLILILIISVTCSILCQNSSKENFEDKTCSPYFYVKCDDASIDGLPLLKTDVNVNIAGVIADVTVSQIYKNAGSKPLEAIYIFPASTRAAVYEMTMTVGDRVLKAEIRKKDEARQMYNTAKSEGKTASLLEQKRPNVFQMNIANILPGDTIIVEMKYTEMIVPEEGEYEFVFPTVVGPRYVSLKESAKVEADKFTNIPYQKKGEKPFYKFNLSTSINAGIPVAEVYSKSHKFNISNNENFSVDLALDSNEIYSSNKDVVINYRLCGNKILSGLLLHKGEKENFFCLTVQPPKQVEKKDIPKREYIFIVDVSGSMNGFPLDISKKLIFKLLDSLKENDLFNILFFSNGAQFLSCSSLPVTKENIANAMQMLNKIEGSGGTEMLPAIQKVMRLPKKEGYSRTIAIFTDGYVAVELQTFELIRNNLDKSNFFAFGIGESVNRFLIEGIARAGQALPFIALNQNDADLAADKFLKYIKSPVLTDIKIEYDGFMAYDIEPKSVPDVLSERPIVIYGKYHDDASGAIHISGTSGDERLKVDIPVLKFATYNKSQALKYLWARNKIACISDYNSIEKNQKLIDEVTQLGLNYNLLTNYTSFIAIDYLKRNNDSLTKINQALPLPEGVANSAIAQNQRTTGSSVSNSQIGSSYNICVMCSSNRDVIEKMYGIQSSRVLSPVLELDLRNFQNAVTYDYVNENEIEKLLKNKDSVQKVDEPATFDEEELYKNLIFPESERMRGKDTTITLRLLIANDGYMQYYIVDTVVYRKGRNSFFNNQYINNALYALNPLKFDPARKNYKKVCVWQDIKIDFNFSDYQPRIVVDDKEKTLINGIKFETVKEGSGPIINKGDNAAIAYDIVIDKECDETVNKIENNIPVKFIYRSNKFNVNIQDGMLGMKKGEIRKIKIPANRFFVPSDYLNYSKSGSVTFKVELLNIE